MSHQLRVSALLPSRKPGVDHRPTEHGGKATTVRPVGVGKSPPIQLEIAIQQQLQQETTTDEQTATNAPAEPRRTRANSRAAHTPKANATEAEEDAQAQQEETATVAGVPAAAPLATPSKRKLAAAPEEADEETAPTRLQQSAKKRKTRHQQSNEEADEPQGEGAAGTPSAASPPSPPAATAAAADDQMVDIDSAALPPALTASADAPMELSLGFDLPFVLPPLGPISAPTSMAPAAVPVPAPTAAVAPQPNARALSRGASMLAKRGVPLPDSAMAAGPTAAHPAAATLPSQTVAKVRAANAAHASVMAMLNELAPPQHTPAAVSTISARAPTLSARPSTSLPAPARPFVFPTPATSSAAASSRLFDPKPAVLPFPTHFNFLIKVFSGLDSTLDMLLRRQKTNNSASWQADLKAPLTRVIGKDLTLAPVQQLMTIYRGCYSLKEAPATDAMGRLSQDYRVAFGPTTLLGWEEDEEEKIRLDLGSAAEPLMESTTSRPNLAARRQQLEQRMKQYVYDAHQRFLVQLQADAAAGKVAPPLASADLASIAVMLQTPLSRLPVWHPLFQLDSAAHCSPLALVPLPNTKLAEARADAAAKMKPMSLLQLTMRQQPVPQTIALERENRGQRTSTNGGAVKKETPSSAPAAAAPAAASSSTAAAAPVHKSLSVLSSSTLQRLSSSMSARAAQQLQEHGDPKARESLRQLIALKGFYEAVKGHLKQHQQNPLIMLVPELAQKLQVSGKFGDGALIRQSLVTLTHHLPKWCLIKSSGRPPVDVFQTKRHPPGADQNLVLLDALVAEQEKKLRAHLKDERQDDDDDDARTVHMETAPSAVASATEPRVKIEGEIREADMVDAGAAAAVPPPSR